MGIDRDFGLAYAKSQLAAGTILPQKGNVFISLKDKDKKYAGQLGRKLHALGFSLLASQGTAGALSAFGVPVQTLFKVSEGRPNVVDYLKNNEVALIINTPSGLRPKKDTGSIRAVAVAHNTPLITTIPGALAAISAIESLRRRPLSVCSLQSYHRQLGKS